MPLKVDIGSLNKFAVKVKIATVVEFYRHLPVPLDRHQRSECLMAADSIDMIGRSNSLSHLSRNSLNNVDRSHWGERLTFFVVFCAPLRGTVPSPNP